MKVTEMVAAANLQFPRSGPLASALPRLNASLVYKRNLGLRVALKALGPI